MYAHLHGDDAEAIELPQRRRHALRLGQLGELISQRRNDELVGMGDDALTIERLQMMAVELHVQLGAQSQTSQSSKPATELAVRQLICPVAGRSAI